MNIILMTTQMNTPSTNNDKDGMMIMRTMGG